jgi:hypothetical protein
MGSSSAARLTRMCARLSLRPHEFANKHISAQQITRPLASHEGTAPDLARKFAGASTLTVFSTTANCRGDLHNFDWSGVPSHPTASRDIHDYR